MMLMMMMMIGPASSESVPEDGKLKSEVMVKDNRRYYLDLKENQRGRFLRVRYHSAFCQHFYSCNISFHKGEASH